MGDTGSNSDELHDPAAPARSTLTGDSSHRPSRPVDFPIVADEETVLAVVADAPWLPTGGRAEIVRSPNAPSPAGLVRLLLCDGDRIFCEPRSDSGKLDLPTSPVAVDDPDGRHAAIALAQRVFGRPVDVAPVGFVRNVVPVGAADYPWAIPVAHFTVWTAAELPNSAVTWVDTSVTDHPLRDRHWWPIVDR